MMLNKIFKHLLITLLSVTTLVGCTSTPELLDPQLANIEPQSIVEDTNARHFALVGVDGKPTRKQQIKPGPHIIYVYGLVQKLKENQAQKHDADHNLIEVYSAKHALKIRVEAGQSYQLKTQIEHDHASVWLINATTGEIASSLSTEKLNLEQIDQTERIKITAKKREGTKLRGYITDRDMRTYFRKFVAAPAKSEAGNKFPKRCLNTAVCMG